MKLARLYPIAAALGAAAVLGFAAPSFAAPPNVSSNPDTDTFRTAGCTGCFITQMNAVLAQFSEITRVFRDCYTGSATFDGASADGCAGGGLGTLADFVVIQGKLKDCNPNCGTTPPALGVPGGSGGVDITYRVSATGSSQGNNCARDPASPSGPPVGVGFAAPEGFDGAPGTADDAGGNGAGHFGQVGPGIGAGTATMSAAPLTACNTKVDTLETVPGTVNTYKGTAEFCIVNFDIFKANGTAGTDGLINNDQPGSCAPGGCVNLGGVAGNESTNLKLSCDTGFADLPPGDFSPPKAPFKNQNSFGAQIFKLVASRDTHASSGTDDKVHLAMPQIQNIFGEPAGNSVCKLSTIGAASGSTTNTQACIRLSGSGSRETFRLTFMANTEGNKTQSEDATGGAGTTTNCTQNKEGGGLLFGGQKIVQANNGTGDVVNCMNTTTGSFGYLDADRFGGGFYSVVVDGVDADAQTVAPTVAGAATARDGLKQLVKCGQYRFWGPLTGGVGAHNGGASPQITAHLAALGNPTVYANALQYIPFQGSPGFTGVGFSKGDADGPYTIAFVPTTCPGAPNAPLGISASPTVAP